MHDILPEDQKYFRKIVEVAEGILHFYGFGKIDIPVLEQTELFSKGTGLSTDIVQKQMYNLKTRGDDLLTLRPEFTPGIVRAYVEHGMVSLPQPIKLYAVGPVFRYENPQAGRFRQFNQLDIEIIGEKSPVKDAQLIQIFYNIFKELKIKNLMVEVNSIGDSQCRSYYKKLLMSYLRSREHSVCGDCRRRMKENPLRFLDCKEEKCQPIKAQAPQTIDHLCEECHNHFKEVLEFLDEIEVPYRLNPYLVRGLDYYTKTVFEIFQEPESKGETAPIALAGGGRFDGLVKLLGGKDASACGGAAGIERIVYLMKTEEEKKQKEVSLQGSQVFLAQLGDLAKRRSLKLLEEFRKARIDVAESFGRDSLRAQLGKANNMKTLYTLILGQREALEGTVIIKDMVSGRQETVKMEKAVEQIKKKLKK